MLKLLTTARRGTRGFSLVEVLVFMVIITIVAGAFTVSAIAATKSQTAHKNTDIASQVSTGVLERAKSTPWSQLGFTDADPGYTPTYEAQETVTVSSAASGERILPVRTVNVKGVEVTLTTHITWVHKEDGGPDDDPENTFGTKRVTTLASWTDAGGAARTARYSVTRTAEPDEAVSDETVTDEPAAPVPSVPAPVASPTGQAGGADDGAGDDAEWEEEENLDETLPGCPPMTVTAGYARAALAWTPVPGASYRVYIDDQLRASPTVGSSSYTYVGLTPGIHQVRVDAVKVNTAGTALVSEGCTTRGVDVLVPPAMTCPPVTITTELGLARLTWTGVTAASSYEVYRNGAHVRTVPEGATSTTFTGLAPGNYTFKVTSKLMADESAGCASKTVLVPAPIPDCPTVSMSAIVEEGAIVYTFPQVAVTTEYRFYVNGNKVKAQAHSGQVGTQMTYKHTGLQPGTYNVKVNPVGLLGDERTNCATQPIELEPNTPVCPTYAVVSEPNGPLTFKINTAKRVDTYIVFINGAEITRIDKSAVPATRTFAPSNWNNVYGSAQVQVLGYNATTQLTTQGCETKTVPVEWPSVPTCPTAAQFSAAVSGRTIVGQMQRIPSVYTSKVEALDAGGAVAFTANLPQAGGSFTTGKLKTGPYTVRVTVDNPVSNPLVCAPPISLTMPPIEYSDSFSPHDATCYDWCIDKTEVGGVPWEEMGTWWLRNGGQAGPWWGGNPNPEPMLVIDAQMNDVDVTVPFTGGTEAIYFRVSGGTRLNPATGENNLMPNNWWRTRMWKRTVTENYIAKVTEYAHPTYATEYLWQPRRIENQYLDRYPVYIYDKPADHNQWANVVWGDFNGGFNVCGAKPDEYITAVVSANSGSASQRKVSANGTCTGGKNRWLVQDRNTYVDSYYWSPFGAGSNGGTWSGDYDYKTGADNYVRPFESSAAPPQSPYRHVGTDVRNGGYYWSTGPWDGWDAATGATQVVNDPGRGQYWSVTAQSGYDYTVSSRQIVTGYTWSTTYCACTTRVVDKPDTRDVVYRNLVVEKSVNGTVTQVKSYVLGSAPVDMRVTTKGNTIRIRTTGVDDTITDATHQAATRHGVGIVPIGDSPAGGHFVNSFKLIEVVP